jgi:hypothetical protein
MSYWYISYMVDGGNCGSVGALTDLANWVIENPGKIILGAIPLTEDQWLRVKAAVEKSAQVPSPAE